MQYGECAGQEPQGKAGVLLVQVCVSGWGEVLLLQGSPLWPGLFSEQTQLRRLRKRCALMFPAGPFWGLLAVSVAGPKGTCLLLPFTFPAGPWLPSPQHWNRHQAHTCSPYCVPNTKPLVSQHLGPPNAPQAQPLSRTCTGYWECGALARGYVMRDSLPSLSLVIG